MRLIRRCGVISAAMVALLVSGVVATAAAAADPPEGTVTQAQEPVAGQYIVELHSGIAGASASALTQRYGGQVMDTYRVTFSGFSVKGMSARQARRLAADPAVKAVHQDGTAHAAGEQTNPPSWGLDQIDQKTLNTDKLYKYPNTADNVTAYVVDSGVNKNHTEFEGRASFGYDFVDKDADASDCFWHGTHVSGTIAGKTVGVAKKAKVVAVRSLDCGGSGPDSATVSGLEWVAANGKLPAVVNLSIKMDTVGVGDAQIKSLVAKGFVVSVAGGNDGMDSCQSSPSRVPEAISVGWMNQGGSRSGNYGTCLDLFAPGGNIYSADHTGGYRTGSGTSMATPHVTGAAALYLQAHPGATPQQVRDDLVANATPGLVTNPGTGSPNKLLYTGFIGGDTPSCQSRTSTEKVAIPDASSVTSTIEQSGCTGQAPSSLAVRVDIDHTFAGDLALDLLGPGGKKFPLRQANAGESGSDGIHQTYTVNASSETANGTWKLQATDVHRYDVGTLTSWSVF